jgi:hypothetical protein
VYGAEMSSERRIAAGPCIFDFGPNSLSFMHGGGPMRLWNVVALVMVLLAWLPMGNCTSFAQQSMKVDSYNIVEARDSTVVEEADSTEEEEEEEETPPWTITAQSELAKSDIRNGVDLSGLATTSTTSASLYHASGFHGGFGWASMLGSDGGPLSWAATLGFDCSFFDMLDFSVGVTHTKYLADSINPLTDLQNSLSAALTANLSILAIGLGYEVYLGSDPGRYLTATMTHTSSIGALSITPSASLSYMSQKIDATTLAALAKKLKKKAVASSAGSGKSKVTVSGVSCYSFAINLKYNVGAGFHAYFQPAYEITPKSEVSSKDRQFLWMVGVEYSAEF